MLCDAISNSHAMQLMMVFPLVSGNSPWTLWFEFGHIYLHKITGSHVWFLTSAAYYWIYVVIKIVSPSVCHSSRSRNHTGILLSKIATLPRVFSTIYFQDKDIIGDSLYFSALVMMNCGAECNTGIVKIQIVTESHK